ncbi:MAG: T9SS type A sorting domain-containing protein, partial [Ignavibacteriae bacterium]|nr:T9SS type A sorting domain-containing protein [Ignavibacteriota bacterium]
TETLEHWNNEKEFTDALLKMLPDTNGTQVNILPGVPRTFDFSYTAKSGDIWKPDQLNVVAFLQNNSTGEIIQAATTVSGEIGSMVGTTLSFAPSVEPMFVAAAANESVETKIVIGNVGKTAMQYSGLSITKALRTPSDWTMTVDNYTPDFTLDPGKTKEIAVKLTRGTSVGSGAVEITFKEVGGRTLNAVPITIVAKETEGFLVLDNQSKKTEPFASAIAARTTKKTYSEISPEHISRYSQLFPNFKRMIWNEADSGVVDVKDFAFISSVMRSGISTFIAGQRTTYEAAFNGVKAVLDTMGVKYSGLSKVTPFIVKGYAGDSISDGFNEQCILANYPLYVLTLVKPGKPGVTPFLSIGDTIVGVRYQSPTSRMVYMSINPTNIQNATSRNALLDKALIWLEASVFTPVAKITASLDTLNFGVVTEPKKLMSVSVTNTGNVPFQITDISIAGTNPGSFEYIPIGLPVMLPVGAKQDLSVNFLAKDNDEKNAILSLKSPQLGANPFNIHLKGRGQILGVDENPEFDFKLTVQPNPANDKVSVTYSTQSNEKVLLQLCDNLGRVVRKVEVNGISSGNHTSTVETADLPAGKYTIILSSGNQRNQVPLMIIR